MNYNGIIGHIELQQKLQRSIVSERTAHSLLFIGQKSVGKTTLAIQYAKALLCNNNAETGIPCGGCDSCKRFDSGNHPDFTQIKPEGAGEAISIKTLRESVYNTLIYAPLTSKVKIYIIERADRMGWDAANSMLKDLEEPPKYVYFILTAENSDVLPATILSRCRVERLGIVPTEDITKGLIEHYEVEPKVAETAALASNGTPGIAVQLIKNESAVQAYDNIKTFVSDLANAKPIKALKLADELRDISDLFIIKTEDGSDTFKRSAQALALETLAGYFRDAMLIKASSSTPETPIIIRKEAEQLANNMSLEQIKNSVNIILSARKSILGNANAQIVTEWLFTEMLMKPD